MEEYTQESVSSILGCRLDINCPHLGDRPFKILCYYTVIQKAGTSPLKEYKRLQECYVCKCYPGVIWVDKPIVSAVKSIVAELFRSPPQTTEEEQRKRKIRAKEKY